MFAFASEHEEAARTVVSKIEEVILFPVISFMLAVAFLYFLWGAYEFVANAESDSGRDTGKTHMFYGIIGMVVMVSALAILRIAAGTFGLEVNVE